MSLLSPVFAQLCAEIKHLYEGMCEIEIRSNSCVENCRGGELRLGSHRSRLVLVSHELLCLRVDCRLKELLISYNLRNQGPDIRGSVACLGYKPVCSHSIIFECILVLDMDLLHLHGQAFSSRYLESKEYQDFSW